MSSSTAYILYMVFTLGAVGVYFLLPRAGRSKTLIGAVFGLSAVAALITFFDERAASKNALVNFLKKDENGWLTFVITVNTSEGQETGWRFGSKESKSAPTLQIRYEK